MTALTVGRVRLATVDPPLTLTCLLGPERPDVTSGYGGWDEVIRPRRPPITTWKAPPSLHLSLSLMLDGHADDEPIEDQIDALEKMATASSSKGEPPLVKLSAVGGAVPHTEKTWVVGELVFGDAIMDSRTGDRTRQQATVTLYEFVADVYVKEESPAQRRRVAAQQKQLATVVANPTRPVTAGPSVPVAPEGPLGPIDAPPVAVAPEGPLGPIGVTPPPGVLGPIGASSKRVAAKVKRPVAPSMGPIGLGLTGSELGSGEDLLSIAARELGDARRWTEIAAMNGIRDPRSIRLGQVLRLP